MKVTIKVGKESKDIKILSEKDARRVAIIVNGDLLKAKIFPDMKLDKITYKIDGEKVKAEELLSYMKQILRSETAKGKKSPNKKSDKKSKKKNKSKDKSDGKKAKKNKDKKNDKGSKKKKKKNKGLSKSVEKQSNTQDSGRVHMTRIRH